MRKEDTGRQQASQVGGGDKRKSVQKKGDMNGGGKRKLVVG